MPPYQRRGCTLSSSARGAKPLTHHGPLQRLLDRRGSFGKDFPQRSVLAPNAY